MNWGLVVFLYWGGRTGLPKAEFDEDMVETVESA
ncbi:hypothetical protein BN000_00294 [Neobacillus massiliamazoniensis]|uniref:Uncharacterized protein n=1 Tax=Neobacillus massiliamazoniensis TaxID=1499688 RepID=A0A0U1NQT9_9BACI|nr:hypothetical protein BN000_00294 [Neobacillus massiliamazoniensis]